MKLTGEQARIYREQFAALAVGNQLPLPSPFPGIDTKAQLFLIEKTENWWLFEAYLLGIRFGKVTAEFHDDAMEFEEV
jgi:hypothetical protein